ncbi:MAG: branched-chain amino acid ABC transporter permease [Alphaproteobacteria bacterium]|nr:MAG: branched-chain amino acid ABC transporter permease [Alphaproteobacteria bacterium]
MTREGAVNAVILALLAAVALAGAAGDRPFLVTLAAKVAILGLAGVGLNIALGFGGLVSFGHAAFFGLGGYVAGILASHAQNYEPVAEWPITIAGTQEMLIIWPAALAACALAAAVIGALSLRTSGIFFIMITLAFAQMLYYFAISWPAYGGEDGLPIYLRNAFPGLDTMDGLQFFALCLAALVLGVGLSWRLRDSRFGLALEAARQNPERVAAVGIRVFRVRLAAFVISAAITGLAGALYADLNRFVSPAMLSWQTSGELIVLVILGGVGRLWGPVAGAGLFVFLEHVLGGVSEYWQALLGLMLLGVVLFARGGLLGLLAGARRHG